MVAEPAFHQIQHIIDDIVRGELHGAGKRDIARGGFAVVVIIIPLTPSGVLSLHQQPGLAAHVPVKILHPQGFAPLRPIVKFSVGCDEPIILQQCHLQRAIL